MILRAMIVLMALCLLFAVVEFNVQKLRFDGPSSQRGRWTWSIMRFGPTNSQLDRFLISTSFEEHKLGIVSSSDFRLFPISLYDGGVKCALVSFVLGNVAQG